MTDKENIKQLISSGNTALALDKSLTITEIKKKNDIIKLKNRYERIIKAEIAGIVTRDEINIEINKINNALLLILEGKESALKSLSNFFLILFILGVIATAIYYTIQINKTKTSQADLVTIVQVDIGILNSYYLYSFKEVVEKYHNKNPKYHLDTFPYKDDEEYYEEGVNYKYLNVILNPIYEYQPLSRYKYYENEKKQWIPLYANVKDEVMLINTPFPTKDSLVNFVPELKILDSVKDTIILTGIYTGVSKIKYDSDLGGVYCELRFNKKGLLREYIFEVLPD